MNCKIALSTCAFVFITTLCSCKKTCNQVEQLDPTCVSTKEYNPVCGCNGKTYSNPGVAQCHGITIYTEGTCN